MGQSIGLAILAFIPHPPIIALYALALAGGTFLAFDNPLRRSFVSEMVPPPDLPNAIVLYSTIVNGSRIFGPALAGVLIVSVGYGWCFTLDAASYLAVLVCLFLMRERDLHRLDRRGSRSGSVREGLRYVFAHPPLWISFLMFARGDASVQLQCHVADLRDAKPAQQRAGLHAALLGLEYRRRHRIAHHRASRPRATATRHHRCDRDGHHSADARASHVSLGRRAHHVRRLAWQAFSS